MKKKTKIISGIISAIGISALISGSIAAGLLYKPNGKSTNSDSSSLTLNSNKLNLSDNNSLNKSTSSTKNTQTVYSSLSSLSAQVLPITANYAGSVPSGYHLKFQWYHPSSDSNKINVADLIPGANGKELPFNLMGIKSSNTNPSYTYYYFVQIQLVSNATNKIVSSIVSDVYKIKKSDALNNLSISGSVLNTVQASENSDLSLFASSNNHQTVLSATPSVNIPSSIKVSYQWYYSGTTKTTGLDGNPINGEVIPVSSSSKSDIPANNTANTSSLVLNAQELKNTGTYYYYVVMTLSQNNASETIYSSYYTVNITKNTVIASVSAQSSTSNVVVNQENFQQYPISLNPNISWTNQNSNTTYNYQWYRSTSKLDSNNVEQFISEYKQYAITSEDNPTYNQEIYYLNPWDADVKPNTTYYYYLLITGSTYGVSINPILTTIPVTVTFDATPKITVNKPINVINIDSSTSSYSLKPNVSIQSSKLVASTSEVYQWYYSLNSQITSQEWNKGSISISNNTISLSNISNLQPINDATSSTYDLTKNNFINSSYYGKKIYFYLIVAYTINGVVVSNLSNDQTPSPYAIEISEPSQAVASSNPSISFSTTNYYLVQNQTSNLPTFTPEISGTNSNEIVTYQWYSSTSNDASYNSETQEVTNASAISNATNEDYSIPSQITSTIGTYYYYLLLNVVNLENNSISNVYVLSKPITVQVSDKPSLTFGTSNQTTFSATTTNNAPISLTSDLSVAVSTGTKLSDYTVSFEWFMSTNNNWTYSSSASSYLANNSASNTYSLNSAGTGYSDTYTIDSSYFNNAGTKYFYVVAFLSLNGKTITYSQSQLTYKLVVQSPDTSTFNVSASTPLTKVAFVNQSENVDFAVNASYSANSKESSFKYQWVLINGASGQEILSTGSSYEVNDQTLTILPSLFTYSSNLVYQCNVSLYVNNQFVSSQSISFTLNVYANPSININSTGSLEPISKDSSIVSSTSLNKTVIYNQTDSQILSVNSNLTATNDNNSSININSSNVQTDYSWYISNSSGQQVEQITSTNTDYSINKDNSLVINSSNFTGNSFTNETGTLYYLLVIQINNLQINSKPVVKEVLVSVNVIAPPSFSFSNSTTEITATVNETNYQTLTASASYTISDSSFANAQITYAWYKVTQDSQDQSIISSTNSYTLNSSDILSSEGTVEFYVIASVTINGTTYKSSKQNYTVQFVNAPTISLGHSLLNYAVYKNQNSTITLSASVTSSDQQANLNYQWYICDANGNNATAITSTTSGYSGYNTNTLSIASSVYNNLTNTHVLYYYLQVTSIINGVTIYQNNNTKSIFSLTVNGPLQYSTDANQTNLPISTYVNSNNVTLTANPSVVYENYASDSGALTTYNNVTFTYNWYQTGDPNKSLSTSQVFDVPSDLLSTNTSFYYVATASTGISLVSSLESYTSGKYDVNVSSLPTLTISASSNSQITTIVGNEPTAGFLANISISNSNSQLGGISNLTYTWYKLSADQAPSVVDSTWVQNNASNVVSGTNEQYFSNFSSYISSSNNYYFYCVATAEVNGTTIYSTSSVVFSLIVANKPVITVSSVGKTSLNIYQDQSSASSFQISASVSFTAGSGSTLGTSTYALDYQWFEVPSSFVANISNLTSLMNGEYTGASELTGQNSNTYSLPISTLQKNSVGSAFYYFCVAYIKVGSNYYFAQNGNMGKINQVTIYSSPSLNLSTPSQKINTYVNANSNVLQVNASVTATGANNVSQILSVSSYTYNWYQVDGSNYSELPSKSLQTESTNNSLNTFTIPSDLLTTASSVLYFVCQVEVPYVDDVNLNTESGGLVTTILFTVNVSSTPEISITTNLSNQVGFNGQTSPITFNVNASLDTNLSNITFTYQWYSSTTAISAKTPTAEDGTLISGNDSSLYEIKNISNTSTKPTVTYYFVIISATVPGYSSPITAVSNVASLTIYPTPSFTTSSVTNESIYEGQTSNLANLNSNLTWSGNYNAETALNASYQWYRSQTNGLTEASSLNSNEEISNANSLSYQLTTADSSLSTGNWYYYLVVTYNLPGSSSISKVAQIATVDILTVPTINVSALNATVNATIGETNYQTLVASVSLTPTSSSSPALTYKWYSSSTSGLTIKQLESSSATSLSNSSNSSSYTLTSSNLLSSEGTEYFYLVVSGNINGAALTSQFTSFAVNFSNSPTINVTINPTGPITYYLNQSKSQSLSGTYSISDNTGLNNVSYSWYYSTSDNDFKNATQISSETKSSLTLTNKLMQEIYEKDGSNFYIYFEVSGTIDQNSISGYSAIEINVESAPTFSYPNGTTNIPSTPFKVYNPSSSSSSGGTSSSQSVTVGPSTQPTSSSSLSYSYQWYYSTTFNSSNPSSLSSSNEIPDATSNQYSFLPTNVANSSGQTFNDIVGKDGGTIYLYLMVTGTNSSGSSTTNYYGPYTFSIQTIPSITVTLPTSPISVYYGITSGFSTITPTLTPTDSSNNPLTSSDFTVSYYWQWKIKGSSTSWSDVAYPGDNDSILTIGKAFTQSSSFDNQTVYIQLTVTITSNLDKASQTFVSTNDATINFKSLSLLTITPTSSLDINGYVGQTSSFPTISYKINNAVSGMQFNYQLYSTTNRGWALSSAGIWGFTDWNTVETIASTTSSNFSYTLNSSDFNSAQTVYYTLAVTITYNGASTIQYWTGWTGSDSTATSAASGVYTLTVNNLTQPTITPTSTTSFTWYKGQTSSIVLKPEEVSSSISNATLSYQWIIQSYSNGSTTTPVNVDVPTNYSGNDLSLPITSAYMDSDLFNLSNVPLTIGDTYNLVLQVTLTINGASISANSSLFSIKYASLTNATITMPTDTSYDVYENQTTPVYFSPTVTNNMSSEGASLSYQWKLVSYLPYDGKTTNFSNDGINISSTYGGNNALLQMSYTNLAAILSANSSSLSVGTTYYFVLEVTTSLNGASVSTTSSQFSLQYTSVVPNLTLSTTVSTIYNGQTENLPVLSVALNNSSDFSDYTITYTWCVGYSDSSGAYLNWVGTGSSFQTTYSTFKSFAYTNNAQPYFMVFVTLTSKDGYSQIFSSAQISTTGYNSGALTANLSTYSNGFLPITLEPAPTINVDSQTTSVSIIQNQTTPVTFSPRGYDVVDNNNQLITSGVAYSFQWYIMPTGSDPQGQAQADSYGSAVSNGKGISGAKSSTLELTNNSTYFQNTGNYFFYLVVNATWNGITLSSQYTYYYELSVSAIPTLNIDLNYQNIQVYDGQSTNLPVLSLGSKNNADNSEFNYYNIKYNWYIAYASANSTSLPSGQGVTLLGSGTSLQITYDMLNFLYTSFDSSKDASAMGFIFVQAVITSSTGASEIVYSSSSITGITSKNETTGDTLSNGSSNGGYVNISAIAAPSITIDSSNNQATTVYKNQTSPVVFQPKSMTVNNNTLNSTYAVTYQWYIMPTGSDPQGTAQSDSGGTAISNATAWNLELTNSSFQTTGNFYYYIAVTIIVDGISSTTYSNYYELSVINIPTLTFSSSSTTTDTTFGTYDIYTLQTENLPLLNVYTNFSDSEFSGMTITYQWYVTYSSNSGSNVVIESNSDTSSLQLQPSNFSFFVNQGSKGVGTFYVFLSATITTSTGASETFYSTPNTTVATSGSKTTSSGGNLSNNIGYFQINASVMPSFTLSSSSQTINTAVGYNGNISFSPTSISPSTTLLPGAVVQYEYQWYDINNPKSAPSGTASSSTESDYSATTASGTSTNYNYNVDSSYLSSAQTNYFYLVVTVIVNGYTISTKLYSEFYCVSTQTISSFSPTSSSMPWASVNYYSNQKNSSVLAPQFTTPGYNLYGVSYTYDWYINNNQESLDGSVEQITNNNPTLDLATLFADPSSYGVASTIKGTGTYYIYLTVVQNIGTTAHNYNVQGYVVTYNSSQDIQISFNNDTSSYSTYAGSSNPVYIYPDPYASSNGNNNLSGYFTYQWYQNSKDSTSGGTEISGATNSYYAPSISTAGTYYYYVEVTFTSSQTGITASGTSSVYTVTINTVPTLSITTLSSQKTWTNSATPLIIYKGTTLNLPTLSPIITLNPSINQGVSLSYQWYINGESISSSSVSDANSQVLTLNLNNSYFSSLSGTQTLYLVVTMSIPGLKSSTYESAKYYVNFESAPKFSLSTSNQFYYILPNQYKNESFSVNATANIVSDLDNNADFTFEWYSGTSANDINVPISGATSSYLALTDLFSSQPTPGNYYYKVVVSATYNGYSLPTQSVTFYLVVIGLNDVGAVVTGNDSSGTTSTVFGNETTISATYPYISLPTNIGSSTTYKEAWSQTIVFNGNDPYSYQNYWIINQNNDILPFDNALTSNTTSTDLYNNAAELTYQWQEAEINSYGLYQWQNMPLGNSKAAEVSYNLYSNPINYFRLKVSLTNYPDVYVYSPLYVVYYKYNTTSQSTSFGATYTSEQLNYDNWIDNLNNQKFVLISYLTHSDIATWNSYLSNGNYGSDNGTLFNFLFTQPTATSYANMNYSENGTGFFQYFNALYYTGGTGGGHTQYSTDFLFTQSQTGGTTYNSPKAIITGLKYYPAGSLPPGMKSYYYSNYSKGLVKGAWMITGELKQSINYIYGNVLYYNFSSSSIPAGTDFHLLLPFSLSQSITYKAQLDYDNEYFQPTTDLIPNFGGSSGISLSWTNSSFVNDGLWFYFGNQPSSAYPSGDLVSMLNQVMYYGQINASAFNITSSNSYIPSYIWDYQD